MVWVLFSPLTAWHFTQHSVFLRQDAEKHKINPRKTIHSSHLVSQFLSCTVALRWTHVNVRLGRWYLAEESEVTTDLRCLSWLVSKLSSEAFYWAPTVSETPAMAAVGFRRKRGCCTHKALRLLLHWKHLTKDCQKQASAPTKDVTPSLDSQYLWLHGLTSRHSCCFPRGQQGPKCYTTVSTESSRSPN